jgi:hypothetical protein
MKDLICDKLDLEDLNKNDFQVRDQHPNVKNLICKNCSKGPSIQIFIFPKTTWVLRVRWCEVLPFTIFESQKPTNSKGKGPPPKSFLTQILLITGHCQTLWSWVALLQPNPWVWINKKRQFGKNLWSGPL